MKPLNVGLMFFNDDPQKFFPYSQIEVVDLRNGPEGDDMTEQIFKGPIDSMIKSALTYIKNTVIVEKIIKRALKNNGSREPEFETNETRDYFITTIFMHDGFENEIKDRPRTDQVKRTRNKDIRIL